MKKYRQRCFSFLCTEKIDMLIDTMYLKVTLQSYALNINWIFVPQHRFLRYIFSVFFSLFDGYFSFFFYSNGFFNSFFSSLFSLVSYSPVVNLSVCLSVVQQSSYHLFKAAWQTMTYTLHESFCSKIFECVHCTYILCCIPFFLLLLVLLYVVRFSCHSKIWKKKP